MPPADKCNVDDLPRRAGRSKHLRNLNLITQQEVEFLPLGGGVRLKRTEGGIPPHDKFMFCIRSKM